MNRQTLLKLYQIGHGKDDNGTHYLVIEDVNRRVPRLRELTPAEITQINGGLTDNQWDIMISQGSLFHPASTKIKQLVKNTVDPIDSAVFTFSAESISNGLPESVPLKQNNFDVSQATAQDRANYAVMRNILTFAL